MMLSDDVCRVHSGRQAACACEAGRLGWCVLAARARLGRPGSRLPLRTSVSASQAWAVVYSGGFAHIIIIIMIIWSLSAT